MRLTRQIKNVGQSERQLVQTTQKLMLQKIIKGWRLC